MKIVQMVIPELFLPQQLAKEACLGLKLEALELFLSRAEPVHLPSDSLESWLCQAFGVPALAIAPLTLQADGVQPRTAYWMRADPVHIRMQREQMIVRADVEPTPEETAQLCTSLNAHFSEDGLHFVAPHPQRWYVQLASAPAIQAHPLTHVLGRNVHAHLPEGLDALHWHGVFNEIQMLLFSHSVNQAREQRGEPAINSLWLWGGGVAVDSMQRPYEKISTDSELVLAFSGAAGISAVSLSDGQEIGIDDIDGNQLLVWETMQTALQCGDLAAWRSSLLQFETTCMVPLLSALRAGKIHEIALDVPEPGAARRYILTRAALWKLWRFQRPLAYYANI